VRILPLLLCAACAESAPGIYVRDASGKWFTKDSEIDGTVKTSTGEHLSVQIIASGDGDRVHVDNTDPDGRFFLRDLPAAKYVLHFVLPGGERHVEVDLQPSQSRTVDVVVDQALVTKDWLGPRPNNGRHEARVFPIAPAGCAALQRLLGKWKGMSTEEATRQHGPHSLAYEFVADGNFFGSHGGPLFNTKLWAEQHVGGKWCADSKHLFLLSTLHELRIAEVVYVYSLDADELVLDSPEIGEVRLRRIGEPPSQQPEPSTASPPSAIEETRELSDS
jgi:hypothetical protein